MVVNRKQHEAGRGVDRKRARRASSFWTPSALNRHLPCVRRALLEPSATRSWLPTNLTLDPSETDTTEVRRSFLPFPYLIQILAFTELD